MSEQITYPSTHITIKKAKLRGGCMEIEYTKRIELSEEHSTSSTITESCSAMAHADLIEAFNELTGHLAMICDLRESEHVDFGKPGLPIGLNKISVTGFTIGGSDEHEGCVLIGQKKLGSKVLNLVTPFIKWEDEYDPYEYSKFLYNAITNCMREVELYIGGKAAAIQTEMNFPEDDKAEDDNYTVNGITAKEFKERCDRVAKGPKAKKKKETA